jgi:Flp pilus assembly protein TadD
VRDTLGLLLQHQGRLADARAAFEAAIRLDPTLPHPHYNLGIVSHAEGRLEEALQHFQEASRLEPAHADARRAIPVAAADLARARASARVATGIARARAGDIAGARAEFLEALRLDPNVPGARENLAKVGGP